MADSSKSGLSLFSPGLHLDLTESEPAMTTPFHKRFALLICSLLLLLTSGCSLLYEITLTGELLRGVNQSPIVGATVTLFTGEWEHCSTTTDSAGRWSLTTTLDSGEFRPGEDGQLWLDPVVDPYIVRVETDEGTLECPIPQISMREEGANISASMLILVDAAFSDQQGPPTEPESNQ